MKKMVIDGDVLTYSLSWVLDNNPSLEPEQLVRNKLSNISRNTGVDKGKLLISGSIPREHTYRFSLATLQPYKGNRIDKEKPKSLDVIKECLKNCKAMIVDDGLEVDDYLAIEQSIDPDNILICSTDKDLKMIPGHHYNWVTDTFERISPLQGYMNFCKQLLTGDRVDNIKGLSERRPLRGIGDRTALALLSGCIDYKDMFSVVVEQYVQRYGKGEVIYPHWNTGESIISDAKQILQENAQLLWIRRKVDEEWRYPSFL